MKISPIKKWEIPKNLQEVLEKNEYWACEYFSPILVTIEEIQYEKKDMISYQASFGILDEYKDIDGVEWEKLIRTYIEEKEPELLKFIKEDAESSTCVVWTNSMVSFKKVLVRMIELIENNHEIKKLKSR